MDPRFARACRLLEDGLATGVGSAAALEVGDGGAVVFRHAVGHTRRVPDLGPAIHAGTRFDVASLSKIVATTAVTLRLIERGALALDEPIARRLGDLPWGDARASAITVRDLLAHRAGCLWCAPLFERVARAAAPRTALVELCAAEPLVTAPGTSAVYSDVGFILLGALLERVGGARLDVLADELVWQPLDMATTGFVDLTAARSAPPRIDDVVATEVCPRRGLVVGEVHDENAHAAGGIVGHAGVFSTVADLGRFCAGFAASWAGTPGAPFVPALAREFAALAGPSGSTRALGWDTPSRGLGASQAGDLWPRDAAVGHGGFTGTSMWLDLPRQRWVVLLTNRVHPKRTDERIKQLRPRVHDAIVSALGHA